MYLSICLKIVKVSQQQSLQILHYFYEGIVEEMCLKDSKYKVLLFSSDVNSVNLFLTS